VRLVCDSESVGYFLVMTFSHFLQQYYPLVFDWLLAVVILAVYQRSWFQSYRVFALFSLLYVLMDTIGNVMAAFYKTNNLFLYNLVYDVQFLVIDYCFYHWLRRKALKNLAIAFLVAFPIFVLVNTIWFQGFFTWQTYSYVFGGGFIFVLSIEYLWELYISEETKSIFHDPVFWFVLSWILYFGITVPYFGMLNYLLKNYPSLALNYYLLVIDTVDCLRNILLTIGVLCVRTAMKYFSFSS
jgi:hypothetical protein